MSLGLGLEGRVRVFGFLGFSVVRVLFVLFFKFVLEFEGGERFFRLIFVFRVLGIYFIVWLLGVRGRGVVSEFVFSSLVCTLWWLADGFCIYTLVCFLI